MARPKAALVITESERQGLESMAHRSRTAPQLARRARIVLACGSGVDNTTVARKLHLAKPTVGRWRQRFIDKRLRRTAGRATAGRATHDYRCPSRRHRDPDARERAGRGDALEYAESLESHRRQSDECASDLAGIRVAAPSDDHVQAVAGSAAGRQDSRHRGVVSEPAGARRRVLRR